METLPAWNNETEYRGLESSEFKADQSEVQRLQAEIVNLNAELAPWFEGRELGADRADVIAKLQKISKVAYEVSVLLGNMMTFVNCEVAVDAKNAAALKLSSNLQKMAADFSTSMKSFDVFLTKADDSILKEFLDSDATRAQAFKWQELRKSKDLLLTPAEEKMLAQFRTFGLMGWGDLYDQLSGSLKVKIPSVGTVGLAQASGYLRGGDENLRREAWLGIQEAWKTFEEPCAAILNNLSGYRLEEYRKRSHTRKMDFLEHPLVESRIERATLDAMMEAVQSRIEVPRRALRAMAKCLNKNRLDPWDILAPSPQAGKGREYSFQQGTSLIRDAFASVDSSMGEFVEMMVRNNWIEARVLPNKRAGAYCTGFIKSRTPRVFQTYMGSYQEVSTLAHELGHAYHSWVMRDMPLAQLDYPMTLAETASIFAETLVGDHLQSTGDAGTKFEIAWASVSDAAAMLVNIPARFEFEKSFYIARESGSLTPQELSDLTDRAWRKWYGMELSETEKQYWMTKLHFSIPEVSFYNFPYTFGYLFSLGIYAKRAELGDRFLPSYLEILRDTGRMTAEDLIQKHLGQDIRRPEFWLGSLSIVERKVTEFENLLSRN